MKTMYNKKTLKFKILIEIVLDKETANLFHQENRNVNLLLATLTLIRNRIRYLPIPNY